MQSKRHSSIIPVLSLVDPVAGITMLEKVFGFEVTTNDKDGQKTMVLGNQSIKVGGDGQYVGAVRPHHLALSVPDVDKAMHEIIAKGGVLASSMTPDGPLEVPEFWAKGVRYVFFDGPEGVLIELCMKLGDDVQSDWGHDHIGIKCDDIADIKSKFLSVGCEVVAEYELVRPDGITYVSFLERGGSIVELFSPPTNDLTANENAESRWLGCLI